MISIPGTSLVKERVVVVVGLLVEFRFYDSLRGFHSANHTATIVITITTTRMENRDRKENEKSCKGPEKVITGIGCDVIVMSHES